MRKISTSLAENWNRCNFGFCCPNLVAMATPLTPLKFSIAYLNSTTPKTLPYTQKLCRYLVHKWNYAHLNVWRLFHCRYGQFSWYFRKIVEIAIFKIKPQMGIRIHGITSYEPFTTFLHCRSNDAIWTFLGWTMRSMQKILCNFGLFLSKFGCHGNSFGSLENLDSIFEFADPKSLSYTQTSISCTELKSV